jgi:hypothetical protein
MSMPEFSKGYTLPPAPARCEAGWMWDHVQLAASHGDWGAWVYIRPCHRPAVTTVTSGCVHGHVETWNTCAPCARAVAAQAANLAPKCARCGPDHICPVVLDVGAERVPVAVAS